MLKNEDLENSVLNSRNNNSVSHFRSSAEDNTVLNTYNTYANQNAVIINDHNQYKYESLKNKLSRNLLLFLVLAAIACVYYFYIFVTHKLYKYMFSGLLFRL